MPVFSYIASNASDEQLSGSIAADTPRQARDLLRDRGLVVRDLAATREKRASRRRGRVGRQQVTAFVRELSTLLAVGAPLLEALDTLARSRRARFHVILLELRDQVAAGKSLADAMREHPHAFDALCVNITDVGESAGTLESSLERLAEFRERTDQLRGKIGTALIYPCIVLGMALIASLFLMTYVVPGIVQPLIEQGRTLPLPTRVIKGASDLLLDWWLLLIAIAAVAIFAVAAILRSAAGRRTFDAITLRLPLFGELIRKQATVRVAVVISTLLKSGIVLVRALQIAQQSAGNQVLRDALRRAEEEISAGGDVATALSQTDAFPPAVAQVFALGQQSGRLEEMLDRLATAYDHEVAASAQRLTALLEPILILALALLVLFIVLATLLPILEAGNAIF